VKVQVLCPKCGYSNVIWIELAQFSGTLGCLNCGAGLEWEGSYLEKEEE